MADALYNVARCQRGDPKLKKVAGKVASEIKIGDNLMLVSSVAVRLSEQADLGTLAQNQEGAHDAYLGVAMSAKSAGETRNILIATGGVHKFPCAALGQAYDVGTLIGPAGTGAGLAVGLSDYEVVPVATANLAIGKLAEAAASGATTVLVEIAPTLTTPFSGPQAMA